MLILIAMDIFWPYNFRDLWNLQTLEYIQIASFFIDLRIEGVMFLSLLRPFQISNHVNNLIPCG